LTPVDEPTLAAAAGAYGAPDGTVEVYRAARPGASSADLLADRYIGPLRAAGCRDVSVRRLGWRMSFGSPINVTGLVCAGKPPTGCTLGSL
jgi:hypothetical protein